MTREKELEIRLTARRKADRCECAEWVATLTEEDAMDVVADELQMMADAVLKKRGQ